MIFASNNQGKLENIRDIFYEYDIKSLKEANIFVEVEEDQDSFYGNALKKATEIYKLANEPVIADDSGICIRALNGEPGVKTARFLGENTTPRQRNQEILNRLKDIQDRYVEFICNLVYYDGKNILVGEGILKGKISKEFRGENGFGFDEIFELPNGKTLAELTDEEKNSCSARYLASLDLKKKLATL